MSDTASVKTDWSVVIVILIGTFMAVLNSSIVNVALPKIMAVFNSTPNSLQWVLSSYMMTMGVVMPLTGYLADTFGYKRMYFSALAIFVLGSCLCGLAWNIPSLVAARIIQAIGGGIMQPLGMAFIYRVTPREEIGMTMGIWGIAAMAAPAIGPTFGGYLVEYINWRLIFYINVPIGILTLWLAAIRLPETELIKGHRFDIMGLASSVIGLFCLLLALSQGSKHGWTSVYIVSLFTTSLIMLTAFVVNELNHPEPLLELRLFKSPLFTIATIIGSFLNIGMFGAMFLLPILLQTVLGLSPVQTGLILFPAAITTALMMPLSGKIFDKYGARTVVLAGLLIVSYTTYMLSHFNGLTPYMIMIVWLALRGVGMGLSMMPVTTVAMATIPINLTSKASALRNVILQVAGSLGIAMFTTIMQNRQVLHFANCAQSINMKGNEILNMQANLYDLAIRQAWDSLTVGSVSAGLIAKEVSKLAIINAISDCFIIASIFCVLAFICTFFIPSGKINAHTGPAKKTDMEKAA